MDKSTREVLVRLGITFAFALMFFLAVMTVKAIKEYNFIGRNPSDQNTIVVRGEGEVFAVPDVAVFSFSVTEEAKTVEEAQTTATEKMNEALAVLKDSGIDGKDIKTVGYNVYPKYEYPDVRPMVCTQYDCPPVQRQETLVGYEVSHTIEVKVRESGKAGEILSKVGSVGVRNVSGIDFRIDDQKKVEEEARAMAIADARAKAKRLANALGVDIVRVASFNESGYQPYYGKTAVMNEMAADGRGGAGAAPAVQLPAGENKVVSNVEIVYEID